MNLIVWQKPIKFFGAWKMTYVKATIDFKLRSQFADAVQSVPANIAGGYGRRSISEYIQFLYTALSSIAEALTRAIELQGTGQIADDRFKRFNQLHYEVENRLIRLIEKLEQKREEGDWIARIAEDQEEYHLEPTLHHSTTLSLHCSSAPPLHHSVATYA